MFIIFLSFLLKVQRTTSHFGTESRVCCRFSRRRFFFFFFLPLRWLNEEVCNSRRDFIFAWQRWHLRLFKFKTLPSRRCWAEQRDPMWTRGMLKSAWNLAEGFRCQAQQKGAIELEFARGERTPENTHAHTRQMREEDYFQTSPRSSLASFTLLISWHGNERGACDLLKTSVWVS